MCYVAEGVSNRRVDKITCKFKEYGCSERFVLKEILDSYHVWIECKNCGNVFSRSTTFLNKSKNHNIECCACGIHADGSHTPPRSEVKRDLDESEVVEYYAKGNSVSQTARKFGINLRRVRRIIDDAGVSRDSQTVLDLDVYPDCMTGDPWLDEEFVCTECGRVFTRHQYMEKMNRTSRLFKTPKYCSKKCYQKVRNRMARAKKRSRRKMEKDCIIPLGDLVERDGGICQICGGEVDFSDGYYDSSGRFHVGRNYPSLDHIIPLSRGGFHTWDNVQLAHQGCNAGKCDKLV